jgi:hypothetical protein
MFMEIAIGAIGIGVVLMVGFIVVSQVKTALPTASTVQTANQCQGLVGQDLTSGTTCYNVTTAYYAPTCGGTNLAGQNASALVSCPNVGYTTGTSSVMVTVFAGFGLIAVGIIVLAAFGLIQIFK